MLLAYNSSERDWELKQPFFSSLTISGVTYDFAHLEPFTMRFNSVKAGRELRVNVRFSNHCFTRSLIDDELPNEELLLIDHNNRSRIFCFVRYHLSKNLPNIIRSLNNAKCKVHETTSRRNFNYSLEINNPNGPYHVFFKISKSTGMYAKMQDLTMFVESAYHEFPLGKKPDVLGRIGFHVLCTNTYLGKPTSTRR